MAMSQHFLLSAAARTLSLSASRACRTRKRTPSSAIRWADNGGRAVLPECGCLGVYGYTTRKLWKCKRVPDQFSVTSGTIFASRKLPVRDYLLAIAIFVNGAKGHSALQLSRDLDCQYKTAFVLAHKLREAIGAAERRARAVRQGRDRRRSISAATSGPRTTKRIARTVALPMNQTGKRQVVVVARERRAARCRLWSPRKARPSDDPAPCRLAERSSMPTKRAAGISLHRLYDMRRSITASDSRRRRRLHQPSQSLSSPGFVGRNPASIIRIAGPYLNQYANEMAWREDNRRVPNGRNGAPLPAPR